MIAKSKNVEFDHSLVYKFMARSCFHRYVTVGAIFGCHFYWMHVFAHSITWPLCLGATRNIQRFAARTFVQLWSVSSYCLRPLILCSMTCMHCISGLSATSHTKHCYPISRLRDSDSLRAVSRSSTRNIMFLQSIVKGSSFFGRTLYI